VRALALPLALAALAAGCSLAGADEGGDAGTVTQLETVAPSQSPAGDVFGRIPDIVDEVDPSVVAVIVEDGEGSGVIWDDAGVIVTNNHVVAGSRDVEVVFATGERAPAEVQATDAFTDLAVLRVERNGLPAAEFADDLPDVGELAVAIGNPLGFENTVTAGIVSGIDRSIPSGGRTPALVGLLQTDAPISPGNSGGALVNADGQVIGINVAFIPPEARAVSIGFAIPSPTVIDVVGQLLETGEVEHAFLGVEPAELTPQVADRFDIETDEGVLVFSVVEASPAAEAGLRAGDVIIAVDGEPLRSVEDLLAALREHSPGDRIELDVLRGGGQRRLTATLADRPEE
jgi:serine protease DegQ